MTLIGTTLTEHWYLIGMFAFGAVHAYVALQGNKRNKELHELKVQALTDGVKDADN